MSINYRPTHIDGIEILDIPGPPHAQIELTSHCNFACPFCYNIWKEEKSYSSQNLKKEEHTLIAEKLADSIRSVTFSGGEPTIVKWLPEIIDYYSKKNVRCSLITNGALVDSEMASRLKDSGVSRVQVSIHHFDAKMSHKLTGVENSLEMSLRGALAFLHEFGPKHVNVNMVVNSHTSSDIYQMGVFLHSHGFTKFSIGLQSVSGAGIRDNKSPSSTDLILACQQLECLSKELDMKTGFLGSVPICAVPRNLDERVNFYNSCDAAISQIVVGPNGDCRPCVEMPWSGGNILCEQLEKIWKSPIFEEIRLFGNVPEECFNCRYVSTCHGGCRASAYNSTKLIKGKNPLMPDVIPEDFFIT